MTQPPVVAIFNTSPDTVDMLRVVLERAKYVVVSAFTHEVRDAEVDLEAFIRLHAPAAIIYDIAPPYEQNWRFLQHLRNTPALRDLPFVITTTNAARVREVANEGSELHEVVGKPYDLDAVVRAVVAVVPLPVED